MNALSEEKKDDRPPSPRKLSILDAAITAISTDREWTTALVARIVSVPKSIVYHYFSSKDDLVRAALDRYATKTRNIAFDLAMWVAMRHDPILAAKIRQQRADQRELLKIEFEGVLEARLAQALDVGLGLMREAGVEVDEQEVRALFRELVFEHHLRNRSAEAKAGVEEALSS